MLPYNSYKKCFCCGKTYSIADPKKSCSCGGFLYTVGQVLPEEGDKEEIETEFKILYRYKLPKPRAPAIQGRISEDLYIACCAANTTRQLQQQPFPEWCANTGTGRLK